MEKHGNFYNDDSDDEGKSVSGGRGKCPVVANVSAVATRHLGDETLVYPSTILQTSLSSYKASEI